MKEEGCVCPTEAHSSPYLQVTEERVLERIEKLAHALYDEGEWIARIDLVEEGDRLVVREMEEVGGEGLAAGKLEGWAHAGSRWGSTSRMSWFSWHCLAGHAKLQASAGPVPGRLTHLCARGVSAGGSVQR